MFWDGPRQGQLTDALTAAFSRPELARVVRELGYELDHVVGNAGNETAFGDLVAASVRHGWVDDLARAAALARPKSAALRNLDAAARSAPDPVPSLLPYSCDRQDQDFQLAELAGGLRTRPARRPLVCVVHGADGQAHLKYVEYLSTTYLPKLFGLDRERDQPVWHSLDWLPASAAPDKFPKWLDGKLSDKLFGHYTADPREVAARVAGHKLFVVDTSVGDDARRADWRARFDQFLAYWAAWPALSAVQWLVVCLRVEYLPVPPPPGLFRRALGLFASGATPGAPLREFLADPQKHPRGEGLDLVVLGELGNVTREHAVSWAEGVSRERVYSGSDLVERVKELFQTREAFPLGDLARRLRVLLRECCPA